ncbi:MAG: DUF411 domain-containing protein [Rhodocyclaceae bacterium]
MKTRHIIASLAASATLSVAYAQGAANTVEVWKDPNCSCCKDWIAHMEKAGFKVKVNLIKSPDERTRLGMPQQFTSCHTARVDGYLIEGHIPATDIKRMLREQPKALGLAAPGMPLGAPGMDGPEYGGRTMKYDVLLVQKSGASTVFQSHK